MPTSTHHHLHIRDLELHIHLGWTEAERQYNQVIFVDMEMDLPEQPKACVTDDLADTFCYHTLIDHIGHHIKHKSFRLIEHLAQEIYSLSKPLLPNGTKLTVRVKKNPPIATVKGGVSFSVEDSSL